MDLYKVLGLEKTATADEIKKAYRKKAMDHHPDRNVGDPTAESLFKEAAQAYSIIGDPEKEPDMMLLALLLRLDLALEVTIPVAVVVVGVSLVMLHQLILPSVVVIFS